MEKSIRMTMSLDEIKRFESYAEKFSEAIKNANKICISSHVSVDGDNLGSITALYNFLKDLGKDVTLLKSDIIPNQYK
ncbi:MAG: DHH family phosphoesterase, partial [Ezakiella sp.]